MQKNYRKRLWIKKQAVFSRLKFSIFAGIFKQLKRFNRFFILLKKQADKLRKKALKFAKKNHRKTKKSEGLILYLYFGYALKIEIIKLKNKLFWPLKKRRQRAAAVILVFVLLSSLLAVYFNFYGSGGVSAATFTFNQTDWSGGVSASTIAHPTNQSGWTYYQSASSTIDNATPGQISLSTTASTTIQTDNSNSSTGFNLTGSSSSQTVVSGTGDNAKVIITSATPSNFTINQTDNTANVASTTAQGGWAYGTFSQTEQNGVAGDGAGVRLTRGTGSWATSTIDATSANMGVDNSISTVGANTIFISYIDATNSYLRLASSTDGGATWGKQTVDNGMIMAGNGYARSTSIKAIDANTIFIVYYICTATGKSGCTSANVRVAKTTNGGTSWTYVDPASSSGTLNFFGVSISATDANNLFVNYNFSNTLNFIKSTNGGTSWSAPVLPVAPALSYSHSMSVVGSDIFLSFYNSGSQKLGFSKSTNSGATWATSTIDATSSSGFYDSLTAVDANNVFISYQDNLNNSLKFAKSTNGGTTWATSTIEGFGGGGFATYSSISALDANNIYVSYFSSGSYLKLAKSTDGGANWTLSYIGNGGYNIGQYSSSKVIDANNIFVGYKNATNKLEFAKYFVPYNSSGTYTAYVDAGATTSYTWDSFAWATTLNNGGVSVKVKTAGSNASPPSFASGTCDGSGSPVTLSDACRDSSHRYLWYQFTLTPNGGQTNTPTLDSLAVTGQTSAGYPSTGTFTSGIIDIGFNIPNWGNLTVGSTTPAGTAISVKARTCSAGDCVGATDWASCAVIASGAAMSTGNCATNGHRYAQYQAVLTTSNAAQTPSLNDVTIGYNIYLTAQSLISSPYDTGDPTNVMGSFAWDEDIGLPAGTGVTVSLRTSSASTSLATTTWADFTNVSANCSKASASVTCLSAALPAGMRSSSGNRWWQYKITLTSGGTNAPTLSDITITYVVNAPPSAQNVTASQVSKNQVTLTYDAKDTDSDMGTAPPAGTRNYVTPSFEYSLDNGASWSAISTTTITFGAAPPGGDITDINSDGSLDNKVSTSTFMTYTAYWDAKTTLPNSYAAQAKVRITVNDNEAANNTASSTSAAFALDTKNPASPSVKVIASTTPANLTFSASDDSAMQMKFADSESGLNSASWQDYNATSSITLLTDPSTVYALFKDAFGNTTATTTVATPETPANVMLQDNSNLSTEEYRLFIAWKVAAAPPLGFSEYEIYRSTDNITYAKIGSTGAIGSNFYTDTTVASTSRYYYKIALKDLSGDVSFLSAAVNGLAGGISADIIPPVITNVATSSVDSTHATITWDTDELSNSRVDYIISTGGDFTGASFVGVSSMLNTAAAVGRHSVVLSSLTASTTYYFQVKSTDVAGNTATNKSGVNGYSFTTLPGPVISSVTTQTVNNYAATITWDTDTSADSYVTYATTTAFTNSVTVGSSNKTTSHSVTLSGLTQGTRYYYYVYSTDASLFTAYDKNAVNGVEAYYYFITTADNTPPVFSGVSSMASTTSAVVSWTTNKLANSKVQYGLTTAYGAEASGASLTLDHAISLSGLTAASTYHYRLISVDANNNSATSTDYTLATADNVAPIISAVATPTIDLNSATITWTTNEASDSLIDYGTATTSLSFLAGQIMDSVTSHSVSLIGLSANRKYYFQVRSRDVFGNLATDNNSENYYSFTTTADVTAPTIINVATGSISDIGAVITWETNEAADSTVQYGTTNALGTTITAATSTYLHSLSLTGLTASTAYYYKVLSADSSGNTASSSIGTFTTSLTLSNEEQVAARELVAKDSVNRSSGGGVMFVYSSGADVAPPVISQIKTEDVSYDSALINWTTNESGDSLIEYGLTNNYGEIGGQLVANTNHQVKLKKLDSGITYHYRVSSVDAAGNRAYSPDQTFTTTSYLDELSAQEKQITSVEQLAEAQNKDNLLVLAAKKAMDIISTAAKGVSLGALETTLSGQYNIIERLAEAIPAPLLSGEPKVVVSSTGAIIAWRTNKEANSMVAYSSQDTFRISAGKEGSAQQVGNPEEKTTNHIVTINDLKPETVYYYQVRSKSSIGPMAKSDIFSFKTGKESPEISSYLSQIVSDQKAVFKWATNIDSTSILKYTPFRNNILSLDETKTKSDKTYSVIHEISSDDFEAGTVYQVELAGVDKAGHNLSKLIPSFSTAKDEVPTEIYQVQSSSAITPGKKDTIQTVISWQTTKSATSKVYYAKGLGKETSLTDNSTQPDQSYDKKHLVIITKFEPGTIYRFQVESVDTAGNKVLSKIYTILTPRKQETVFDVIKKNFVDVFGWTSNVGK